MATPVKVRGIQFDPFIGAWIGVAEVDGKWIKATFNVAEEPHYQYELFERNGILHLREIAPSGRRTVYQVPWEALDCERYPTNIACTVDVIKLHAIARGEAPKEVPVITTPNPFTPAPTPKPQQKTQSKPHKEAGIDIKDILAGIASFILGLLAFGNKNK